MDLAVSLEVPDDPKVQSLRPDLFKFWINCLCIAGRFGGALPSSGDSSFALRMPHSKVVIWCQELVSKGLFDLDEKDDVTFKPHGWKHSPIRE